MTQHSCLGDISRGTAEYVWTARKPERDVVAAARADFHRIDHQNARTIARWLGPSRAVAVIGDDDELKTRAGCGTGDVVESAATV